jgi:hypothetical protein
MLDHTNSLIIAINIATNIYLSEEMGELSRGNSVTSDLSAIASASILLT